VPGFNQIVAEIQSAAGNPALGNPFDHVRRKYLGMLAGRTGRHTILYASRFLQGVSSGLEQLVPITDEDLQGLMTTIQGRTGTALDLILHSPGGSAEAAEGIVTYLRSKFTDVRVIVPHLAMSAATMIACSANKVLMGSHSFLGPTDPQILIQSPVGFRLVPAQAILEQFDRAREDCKTNEGFRAWAPILPQYGPDLLVTCENASELTRRLVHEWLRKYMLAPVAPAKRRSQKVRRLANFLTDHQQHRTHGRHLGRAVLRGHDMVIDDLEQDRAMQDLVLSVYHATTICFSHVPVLVKIIENHQGCMFGKAGMAAPMMMPLAAPPSPPGAPAPP
jgi:hypothetical protein